MRNKAALYLGTVYKSHPHFPFLFLTLLISVAASWPLFYPAQMQGHDAFAYLPRIEEFYNQLAQGIYFPRWAPDFSSGYGQPFFIFNPPIIYYIGSAFRILGFSFVRAENLTFFCILLLSAFGMYILASEFFGKRGAVAASSAYILGPYFLVNIYVRHALADFSAFAFMPWAWWGLYKYCMEGKSRHFVAGSLCLAALILSANTIALIAFPALTVFMVSIAWRQKERFLIIFTRGLGCLGLGLALAAFFWAPAVFERDLVQTMRLITGEFQFQDHFVHLNQFVYSPWGYGDSIPGPEDGMSFEIGYVQLAGLAFAIFQLKRISSISKNTLSVVLFFLLLTAGSAFLSSAGSIFIWNRLRMLQYFQFPWRFLSLATISTAFLCGIPFLLIKDRSKKTANGLLIGILVALAIQSYSHTRPDGYTSASDADYSPQNIAEKNISVNTFNEFETIWMTEHPRSPAPEKVVVTSGAGQIFDLDSGPARVQFQARIDRPAVVNVNIAYFPGWTIKIDDHPASISYNNPLGVIEFPLDPGNHNVRIEFKDSRRDQAGKIVSIMALLVLLIYPFRSKIFNR